MYYLKKLERDFLIYSFESSFSIYDIAPSLGIDPDMPKKDSDLSEVIIAINYLLDSDYFELRDDIDSSASPWKLSMNESLEKIKEIWKKTKFYDERDMWYICFASIKKGKKAAIKLRMNQFDVAEKVVLEAENKGYIDLKSIIHLVRGVFRTDDSEVIQIETLNSLSWLDRNLVFGGFENGNFMSFFKNDSVSMEEKRRFLWSIENALCELGRDPLEEEILCVRTNPRANRIVRTWEKRKGEVFLIWQEIVDDWKEEYYKQYGEYFADI